MVVDSHPDLHLQEVPGVEVVALGPDPGAAPAAAAVEAAVEKNSASLLGE